MTSSRPDQPLPARDRRGFTLTEVIIASTLGAILMLGVLTMFLMVVRSSLRAANYSMMETQTRGAFEQLGIDARMANGFTANFTSGVITSFTLTIPNSDLSVINQVTYGLDSSDPTNQKFFRVSGSDPTVTTGRRDLITYVTSLGVLRYDASDTLIPATTTSSTGMKHLQVSVSVTRSGIGLAAATQVIRSSAFTIRNM